MKRALAFLVLCLALVSCSREPRNFDSTEWKAANARGRGSMTNDLIERQLLKGKSTSEVRQLLGEPDQEYENSYHYDVNSLDRCYFWECRLEVNFDDKGVTFVGVSD
jgi:hypothetical protein